MRYPQKELEEIFLIHIDAVDISQYLSLYVFNKSETAQPFRAMCWGHALELKNLHSRNR